MKQTRRTGLVVGALLAALGFMQCGGSSSGSDAGVDGGAGGGAMGGGAGGGSGGGISDAGTGGGGSCTQVTFPPSSYQAANYVPQNGQNPPWDWAVFAIPGADAGRVDVFGVELWFFGASQNPSFPYEVTLGATKYGTCEVCLTYQEGCNGNGVNCATFFLAQSGSVTFTQADRASPGQFKGSGSGIRFVEWNQTTDLPRPNGRCVELASYTLDAFWPRPTPDAGELDAGELDAGELDAGELDAGVTDAGVTDAGADSDAGTPDGGVDGG